MHLVSEALDTYCLNHSSKPSPECDALEKHTRAYVPHAQMVSGGLVQSFLSILIKAAGVKRILEIGTFTGYSALAMAEQLPEDGKIVTLDINPETNKVAQEYWRKSPHGKKIESKLGDAITILNELQPGFDLVFIDADKLNYLNYLKRVQKLISINGLIVADNTLWSARVLEENPKDADTQGIKAFNDYVAAQPDLMCSLVPIRDGLMLIRKR